ncbi:hypothetical protein A8B84_20505 [Marinobacter sp. EhC06]|uniref:hypothetical protein n=1 Tax=Marinobacter TaxID=2742 RepID=UPI0007D9C1C2|nr:MULTISPECIES: hypothetical protein [unclassified Marinobacter]OAN92947.1 hypothetical protein A8B84_20505 [Marinobacter sp. EhC06]OAN93098.1 hypothetical protein A8B80_17820 [Marinobacter sp. EhN04]
MRDSNDKIHEHPHLTDQEIEDNPGVSLIALMIWMALRNWNFENFITPRSVRKNLSLTPKVQKEAFEELSEAGLLVHHRVQVSQNRIEDWVMVFDRSYKRF